MRIPMVSRVCMQKLSFFEVKSQEGGSDEHETDKPSPCQSERNDYVPAPFLCTRFVSPTREGLEAGPPLLGQSFCCHLASPI